MQLRRTVDAASALAGVIGVGAALRVHHTARRDEKCGVLASDAWHSCARRRIRAAVRAGRCVSVVVLDVDDFKAVNDRDGHPAGDVVLSGVAAAVGRCVRSRDPVGRIGGDEFAVLLDDVGADNAARIVQRIGRTTQDACAVRVSCGTATAPANGTGLDALLAHADAALYAAKRRRLSAADEPATPASR